MKLIESLEGIVHQRELSNSGWGCPAAQTKCQMAYEREGQAAEERTARADVRNSPRLLTTASRSSLVWLSMLAPAGLMTSGISVWVCTMVTCSFWKYSTAELTALRRTAGADSALTTKADDGATHSTRSAARSLISGWLS
jgi:hypothetical protein